MKYLKMYCNNFNLKISDKEILDLNGKVVGRIESNMKYIKFKSEKNSIKESDLLMLVLENLSVH